MSLTFRSFRIRHFLIWRIASWSFYMPLLSHVSPVVDRLLYPSKCLRKKWLPTRRARMLTTRPVVLQPISQAPSRACHSMHPFSTSNYCHHSTKSRAETTGSPHQATCPKHGDAATDFSTTETSSATSSEASTPSKSTLSILRENATPARAIDGASHTSYSCSSSQ